MARMSVAFEIKAQYGSIVVRDSNPSGDLSEWDPTSAPSHMDGNSAIFAVRAGVDGPVRCEIWEDEPEDAMGHELLRGTFHLSGALVVEDPGGLIHVKVPWIRGDRDIAVLADDPNMAARVQVVVGPRN